MDGIGVIGYIPLFRSKFHHSVPLFSEKIEMLKTPDEIDYHQKLFRQAVFIDGKIKQRQFDDESSNPSYLKSISSIKSTN